MKITSKADIRSQLYNPNKKARGYTRWWWFGGAVTKEEISRELDIMKEAMIGGVELQILYPTHADDKEKGIQNCFYLSPLFFERILYACEEAQKRDMSFDMTLGSSWPFGGPFVPFELSAPNVIPYTLDIKGPCEFSYDFTTRVYGECVGCIMGRMENCQMIPESVIDIRNHITDKYLFGWEWGKEIKNLMIPEGEYKIVIFISNEKRQHVLKPLPGGEGLIIDHNRKDALRCFLKHAGDPIAEKTKGLIQSYFCDSLEVFGQNWTDIIYEEFERRRGYDLHPYIYALWGDIKGYTECVRYDYNKTLAELTEENFYRELTKWCHEKKASSRIQAHGTWGDVLNTYGAADIPEGETFSDFDHLVVNTVHRRLAASSGHVYKKNIISNESFTWLRSPRFIVSLENMKAAVDCIFLDGMNHIVNHGYAYSPENTTKMEWSFYASTQINHNNTWWPYYKELSVYINRVSDWLRRGNPVVRIALYLPQSDIWAENPMSDIHMCMKLEERMMTEYVDAIQKAGYWFDYVNDDVLENFENYSYEALLLVECDRMPVKTAKAIDRYAREGGIIVCKDHVPYKSCGLMYYSEKTTKIKKIFDVLLQEEKCIVVGNSVSDMVYALQSRIRPDVHIAIHNDVIGYVHRSCSDYDIYFVSNISAEYVTDEIEFLYQTCSLAVFDPLSAQEKEIIHRENEEDLTRIKVEFEPYQSLLFIFAQNMNEDAVLAEHKTKRLVDISKNWTLMVEEKGFSRQYECLTSWEQEEELKYYSGEGIYKKKFVLVERDVRDSASSMDLVFENMGCAAEILVNDRHVGILFKHPYKIDIKDYARIGENTIIVKVRNLLINSAIDPEYKERDYLEPVIEEWPYSTGKLNINRRAWVYKTKEKDKIKTPFPSGIWGRVYLEFSARENVHVTTGME